MAPDGKHWRKSSLNQNFNPFVAKFKIQLLFIRLEVMTHLEVLPKELLYQSYQYGQKFHIPVLVRPLRCLSYHLCGISGDTSYEAHFQQHKNMGKGGQVGDTFWIFLYCYLE